MSALALLIVYGNLAVTFSSRREGLHALPTLPCPRALRDALLIQGMFGSHVPFNFDPVIEGESMTRDARGQRRWLRLSVQEHFPMRDSMAVIHLLAPHHRDMLGSEGQRAAWARYAAQIELRHNRLHSAAQVARVRLGAETFPQSPNGYRANKTSEATVLHFWFEAEP